ncbi:unnamed protein product [Cuscuta campestris]|uniref:Uncharacterized protein n=1 Tax=Cuscuta campestris TaxID=132261 RepID=A0A484K6H0_9ASTE|nr:unnamed protein product [Cuscuta campestris]
MNGISNLDAYSSVRCPRTHLVGSVQSKEASLAAGHPNWSWKLPLLAGSTCCPNSVNQGPDLAGRWRSLAGIESSPAEVRIVSEHWIHWSAGILSLSAEDIGVAGAGLRLSPIETSPT